MAAADKEGEGRASEPATNLALDQPLQDSLVTRYQSRDRHLKVWSQARASRTLQADVRTPAGEWALAEAASASELKRHTGDC